MKILKSGLFILILINVSSCYPYFFKQFNPLFNNSTPQSSVRIYTKEPTTVVLLGDTLRNIQKTRLSRTTETTLYLDNDTIRTARKLGGFYVVKFKKVSRVADTLKFNFISDTLIKTVSLASKNDPISLLREDFEGRKYRKFIYVDLDNSKDEYEKYIRNSYKGKLHFNISIPFISSIQAQPYSEDTEATTHIFGASMGMDYYYHNNRFLNISLLGLIQGRTSLDEINEEDILRFSSINLSHNHKIKRFSLGYGISFNNHDWITQNPFRANNVILAQSNYRSLGLNFSTYYQVGHFLHLGFFYRPSFKQFGHSGNDSHYEHLVSFDLLWKIRL